MAALQGCGGVGVQGRAEQGKKSDLGSRGLFSPRGKFCVTHTHGLFTEFRALTGCPPVTDDGQGRLFCSHPPLNYLKPVKSSSLVTREQSPAP